MSKESPEQPPQALDTKTANRSANIGCLILAIGIGIILFSFALGSYSAYRLHEFRAELIQERLKKTQIPSAQVSGLSPKETMKTLKEIAVASDPWFKTIQFKHYTEAELLGANENTEDTEQPNLISLQLNKVTLLEVLQACVEQTKGTLEVIDGSINFLPLGETLEPRKRLQLKKISPEFWEPAKKNLVQAEREFWDIKPMLMAAGFPFPPRSYARYYPRQQALEIQNLAATNESIQAYLQKNKVIP
ncbi:MAG: hypothetical protein SH807_03435 [Blastochloris sp.]|nr:hypothetical protein [Blastochloris sp.]